MAMVAQLRLFDTTGVALCKDSLHTYSGRVNDQKILHTPRLIRAARVRSGLSQKAMAMNAGLDQSLLCAIEKGRRRVHDRGQLIAIGQAAGLSLCEVQELLWALDHDRVIYEMRMAGMNEAVQSMVSAVLQAARLLQPDELAGLESTVARIVRSKRELTSLVEQRDPREEEAHMS